MSQRMTESREPVVRLGRDGEATVSFSGDVAKVVSARHAELRHAGGVWRVVDLGSRNGTFVNGRRVTAETPLALGDVISLGESGPRVSVAALAEAEDETLVAGRPLEARPYAVSLLVVGSGERLEAHGTRIRLGRGKECEIRVADAGELVSRVHAELTAGPTGALVLRDAGSKNGTFLNGERVGAAVPVRMGDRITLGNGGPAVIVEGLGTAPVRAMARAPAAVGQQTVRALIGEAMAKARDSRRRGGRGTTAFIEAMTEAVRKDSARKIRWLTTTVLFLLLLLGGAVYGVYWMLSTDAARSEIEHRSTADTARAETDRLRRELAEARTAAAPAADVQRLRVQLESAQVRTLALEAALARAQVSLAQQMQTGEARRLESQREVERLRQELAAAERRAPSAGTIDSLRRAVAAAETRATNMDQKLRALRGTDFAAVAQQSQGGVGLVTSAFGREYYDGTGFVITPDGYLLTNWHVVADSLRPRPDTIWVTMADQSLARYADVVAVSRERDLALLKVRGYQGPHLPAIDWAGTKARQGEPAALIGFPAGSGFARDRGAVVRTSMTAGILSRVTPDLVQFDGITIGGSSGSPVFNADGDVIAVHRAGLREGPGFALTVPLRYAIPLMPAALRERLGLL